MELSTSALNGWETPFVSAKDGSWKGEVTRGQQLLEISPEAGADSVPKAVFQFLQSRPLTDGLGSITFPLSSSWLWLLPLSSCSCPSGHGDDNLVSPTPLLALPQAFSLDLPYLPCYFLPLQDGFIAPINLLALLLQLTLWPNQPVPSTPREDYV